MSEKITFTKEGRVWLILPPDKSYKPHRQIGGLTTQKDAFLQSAQRNI